MAPAGIVLNSKTCDRDRMVSGILCDVRRRLLDRFQQRVERGARELVHLVDDEHLVAVARRRDRQAGNDDLADVVDAGVAGGVDLEHVDVAPLGNLDAGVARAARLGGRPLLAVERPRQNAGSGRLAAAARPGEDERLGNAPARQGVAQRARHRLLSDDVVEPLRPPLPGEDLVGHRRSGRSGRSGKKWKK
jgi:hypothetical protein